MFDFTNYITEAKENGQKMSVIILANSLDEGTAAKVMADVCSFNNITCNLIDIDKAYLGDADIELRKVDIRNINGKGLKLTCNIDSTIVFTRGGAIATQVGQALVSTLQTAGFFMVNDLESMMLCDNKMATTIAMNRSNVKTPRTVILNNEESIEFAHKQIGGKFPVIIKTLTGTQGIGVTKVDSMSSLVSVCQSLWKFNAQLLMQEFLDMDFDIRTLVVDGKILGSAKRITEKGAEFRSNIHQGADTVPYILKDKEKDLILAAARVSGGYYIGVDHCTINNEMYILEINGSPGIKSHYNAYDLITQESIGKRSDKKLFDIFLKYILEENNRTKFMRIEAGYIETIILEGMEDDPIRAKLDTGNGTNATMLHVDAIKVDGKNVTWKKNGKTIKSKLLGFSKAKHLNTIDERPIIEHNIQFNNRSYLVHLGLTLSDSASEMLCNRDLLTLFGVAINPMKRFALTPYTARNEKNDL